jgi:hypothetical protein
MSSTHKECGADIIWARREDEPDRFMPPLEYAGEVFLITGKTWEERTAVRQHAYRVHMCDPQAIISWQEYQRQLAEAKGIPIEDLSAYEASRERSREEVWHMVLNVDCPRCHAKGKSEKFPDGQKCQSMSLANLKTGEIVELRNPHDARLQAFEEWRQGSDATSD